MKLISKYRALPLVAKVSFWFIACSFLQKGISVLSSPIINRLLTTEDYGLYSIYSSWNSIFSIFATLNLAAGYVSVGLSNCDDIEQRNKLVSSIQGLSTLISSVFLVVFLIFNKWFVSFTTLPFVVLLFMFGSYVFSNSFSLLITKDKFNGKYLRMLIFSIIFSVISPLATILILKFAPTSKDISRILTPIVVSSCCGITCYVLNFVKGKKFFDKSIWKAALLFNLPLLPHYLANIVLASSDRIIINSLVGLSEAGIYGFAYSISTLLNILIDPLYTSIQPWFFKKIESKDYASIKKLNSVVSCLLTIVLIFAILLCPEIVYVFGGEQYSSANSFLPILFSGTYLAVFYTQFIQIEFKHKKTIPIMISSVLAALINVALNYIFIPIFGYTAAAYTTLFSYLLYTIFHYFSQRHIIKASAFNWQLYLVLFIIVLLLSVFCNFLYSNPILRFSLIGVFSLILVIAAIFLIKKRKQIQVYFKKKE